MKPEVGQRREKDGEISATVAGKKSGYVLKEDPLSIGENSVGDPCELEEEAGSLSREAASLSGEGEVLAGESATEQFDGVVLFAGDLSDVFEAGDVGPVSGEDSPPEGVGLALEDDSVSCFLKPEVDSPDAAEE